MVADSITGKALESSKYCGGVQTLQFSRIFSNVASNKQLLISYLQNTASKYYPAFPVFCL